ncbi:BlaI/MecI/CopY family transcriptional regulator [Thalassotalea sp. M1531]|uniref:BlaI/MecI/CopY family transcriptional regulator n=1 Tax=Thalassotalea algicola TaxID=2716224 RepID=A0A7Y0Q6F8_9GAMM|nr:BlaI/MecI/CopY family transcriptional regulator [Thalassotalea algicola]NMP31969.1 BlaI/MecI/CopY family transcriptional regulator [Thalassotalea algicola]
MADISNAELEVLGVLWQQSPLSANEIIERLNEQREWHEKTVKTLLNRLVKKEAIGFEKEQRRYQYYPLIAQENYQQQASQSLVQRLFSGKVSPLVAGFAKNNQLQKDDIESLKALIDEWEQEND